MRATPEDVKDISVRSGGNLIILETTILDDEAESGFEVQGFVLTIEQAHSIGVVLQSLAKEMSEEINGG